MSNQLRLFPVDSLPSSSGTWEFGERLAHHLRVLRKAAGDQIILFDPHGRQAKVEILSLSDVSVECNLLELGNEALVHTKVVLILALTKGKHFETALRMAVELGVHEVHLLQAERSVLKWTNDENDQRLKRIQKIVTEAARQSEVARVPSVQAPLKLAPLLAKVPKQAQRILCSARRGVALPLPATDTNEIWIAVGPEGDFSPEEEDLFEQSGFCPVSLGPTVLRVDTAVAAALALVVDRTYWRVGTSI